MPQQIVGQQSFTFIAGLNTEASYLTFPDNTWKEGTNVVPQINGQLHKRTAIDLEAEHTNLLASPLTTSVENSIAYTLHSWDTVAGDGGLNFAVIQIGATLYFTNNYGSTISTSKKSFTVNLATYAVSGGNPELYECSCSTANGKLLVTNPKCDPILVTYNPDTVAITVTRLTLKIRDMYGYSSVDPMVKPAYSTNFWTNTATNTKEYRYNLLNAGWTPARAQEYAIAKGALPSLTMDWSKGKDLSGVFSPTVLDQIDFGNSVSATGRFILNAFNRDRSAAEQALVGASDTLTTETEDSRPATSCFWAGRAFYAGINSATMANWVMFSQVTLDDTRFDRCYQDADPSSETIFDLVASDGGVIPIYGAGTIIKLVPMHNSLLVFADNGVWNISSTDSGFSALGYSVHKVSTLGAISSNSIVVAESTAFYLTHSGIYTISLAQSSIAFESTPLTDLTIKSLIVNIPVTAKLYLKAVYHEEDRKIYWVYNGDPSQDGVVDRYTKTEMLVLDLRLKAFYTLSFAIPTAGSTMPHLIDGLLTKGRQAYDNNYNVVSTTGDSVIDSNGDTVIAGLAYAAGRNKTIKWLVCNPITGSTFNYTFADLDVAALRSTPIKFRDWYSKDSVGVTYPAYIVTGYSLIGSSDKMKQVLYITVHSVKTETGYDINFNVINPSSILMQTQWDWTDSADANEWTAQQQVYRHTRGYIPELASDVQSKGYPMLTTKNKIRGRGRALALKFSAEVDKDMKLVGWETSYLTNGVA